MSRTERNAPSQHPRRRRAIKNLSRRFRHDARAALRLAVEPEPTQPAPEDPSYCCGGHRSDWRS